MTCRLLKKRTSLEVIRQLFLLFNRLHTIVIVISICYLTHMIFYFVICLNTSIVCETKLTVHLLATLNRIKIKSHC